MYLRRFFSIGIILFSAILLGPSQSFSQGSGTGIIATFAGGAYDAVTPGDIGRLLFGEKPRNIYAFMYDQAKFKPERVAVRRIIEEQTALTEADVSTLRGLVSQSYSFIPEGEQPLGEHPTQEEISRRSRLLQATFDFEREFSELQSEVESEVFVSEVFANGDRDDSGFDLLYDLDVMNAILFGKPVVSAGGGGPGSPAGARRVDVPGGGREEGPEAEGGRGRDGEIPARGEGRRPGALPPEIPGGAEGLIPRSGFSPEACAADTGVDDAIRDFLEKEQAGEVGPPISSSDLAGRSREDRGDEASQEEPLTKTQRRELVFTPDAPGNYRRARACESFFCLEVKARYKKETSFPPTLNCIACHIEKMNDAFKKTLDQGLIPGKVTGNVLEPSKCKAINLGDFANINLILVPSPIITPPNDDMVIKNDAWTAFKKYDEQYRPFLIDQLLQATDAVESPEEARTRNRQGNLHSPEAAAAESASASASDQTSPLEAARNIRAYSNSVRDAQLRMLRNHQAEDTSRNIVEEFQALSIEMEQMNTYFRNIQKFFKDMKKPCDTLANKPYCS